MCWFLKRRLTELLIRSEPGCRWYLKIRRGARGLRDHPVGLWKNSALKTRRQWEQAVREVDRVGLYSNLNLPRIGTA